MKKTSIGVAVFGIVFVVLTLLPGSTPDDIENIPEQEMESKAEGSAMVAAQKAQSTYKLTQAATMFPQLFGGTSYFALGSRGPLDRIEYHYESTTKAFDHLTNFKEEPTKWDRQAPFAENPKTDCTDLDYAIDQGWRDKWGRLTEKGLNDAGKPRCPARARKVALAKEVQDRSETTQRAGKKWLNRVSAGTWIFRIAGLLAVLGAVFGFQGRPKVLGGLLVAAGILPFSMYLFISGAALPHFVVAGFLIPGIVVLIKA